MGSERFECAEFSPRRRVINPLSSLKRLSVYSRLTKRVQILDSSYKLFEKPQRLPLSSFNEGSPYCTLHNSISNWQFYRRRRWRVVIAARKTACRLLWEYLCFRLGLYDHYMMIICNPWEACEWLFLVIVSRSTLAPVILEHVHWTGVYWSRCKQPCVTRSQWLQINTLRAMMKDRR